MADEIVEVKGAEQLAALSKKLKDLGDKDLKRELYAAINRATKPIKARLPASARATLPRKGGLAERVAKSKYKTVRRTSGRQAGIRITATNQMAIGRMDRGIVRHMTFGHKPWENQKVTPGWFTKPSEETAPMAREELARAMDQIAARI